MSKFLLFCKRTRVILKYKCFKYKLHFFEFLSNFIQYFKPMKNLEEKDILLLFDNVLIPHVHKHKGFSFNGYPRSRYFDYTSKSCIILYDMVYKKNQINCINFQISLKVENNIPLFGLFDESDDEDIHNFCKYLQKTEDKYLYAQYMQDVKDT